MTNHAIRYKCSTNQQDNHSNVPAPEPPSPPNVVPDRVKQNVEERFNKILPEQESDGVGNTAIDGSGTDYVYGIRRFDDTENKADIVQAIKDNVVADAEWWRIESHVCDHDESAENRTGCDGWTLEEEHGNVPADVK